LIHVLSITQLVGDLPIIEIYDRGLLHNVQVIVFRLLDKPRGTLS
jgi:hypothetical protein